MDPELAQASSPENTVRVRVDLAYDGTDFQGWARQPAGRTIEAECQTALATVLRVTPTIVVAGRTDAGVHAHGQVFHTDVPLTTLTAVEQRSRGGWDRSTPNLPALCRRLRKLLPADIYPSRVTLAPHGFDARFSALSRTYTYRVVDDARAWTPQRRRDHLLVPEGLDVPAMNDAAAALIGEHDWLPFCRPRAGASTVRTLMTLRADRTDDHQVTFTVQADAFCHHMVRMLTGALVSVGRGDQTTQWPSKVLAANKRDQAVTMLAPHPLVLDHVAYPDDDELAAQAERARRYRGTEPREF